jgi:hypothetical protein
MPDGGTLLPPHRQKTSVIAAMEQDRYVTLMSEGSVPQEREKRDREKKRAGVLEGVPAFIVLTLAQVGQGKITHFVDARPSHSA